MSGISFKIGHDTITPALAGLLARSSNLKPLMQEFGSYLVADTKIRFEREQTPDGKAWPKSLRAIAKGGATLRDKGHLFQSLTYQASYNQVAVGTAKEYAAIHQFGGTITAKNKPYLVFAIGRKKNGKADLRKVKSVTIPARPFLGIGPENENVLLETASDWFKKVV